MREKFMRFMAGRYGTDNFSRFLLVACLVCIVLNWFLPIPGLYFLGVAILVYSYYRMFSRNYGKRSAENMWYLNMTKGVRGFWQQQKRHWQIRKTHHLFKCKQCGKMVKVPKGKGRIQITCTNCRYTFIKNS